MFKKVIWFGDVFTAWVPVEDLWDVWFEDVKIPENHVVAFITSDSNPRILPLAPEQ